MNRYYLDTEFLEDGVTIDLISLALVSEDGVNEYYVGNSGCSIARIQADSWLMKNVMPHLPPYEFPGNAATFWKPKHQIRADLLKFFGIERGAVARQPEIWADFASYDWVAFCQIFGRMLDLPSGLPMFCMDLMQDLRQKGIKRSELPKQDPTTEHNALEDARWLSKAHRFAQGLNW